MAYESLSQLVLAYLEHLRGRPCYRTKVHTASEWILTLPHTPTRKEVMARHLAKGRGHYQPGSCQANMELGLLRAACRWGLYQECWEGGDPTVGIRKWKRPLRKRTGKFDELRKLLAYFEHAQTEEEIRYRALFGLMLFTGCRQTEARCAKVDAITSYGEMGAWIKGKTKTGEDQELPLPKQLMAWIAAWKAICCIDRPNPYLFPGQEFEKPISSELVRLRWSELRTLLGMQGLWSYDLRRTLATSMSNELKYDDSTIRAILNHHDTSALSHYRFKSFDSLTKPIQHYADWLWALNEGSKDECPIPMKPVVPLPATPLPPQPLTVPAAVTLSEAPAEEEDAMGSPTLSRREREVLACLAQGQSRIYIAARLGLAAKTVEYFCARLMDKLHVANAMQLIRYAIEHGADTTRPIPAQPAPPPMIVPAMTPTVPSLGSIIYASRPVEREDWPG